MVVFCRKLKRGLGQLLSRLPLALLFSDVSLASPRRVQPEEGDGLHLLLQLILDYLKAASRAVVGTGSQGSSLLCLVGKAGTAANAAKDACPALRCCSKLGLGEEQL